MALKSAEHATGQNVETRKNKHILHQPITSQTFPALANVGPPPRELSIDTVLDEIWSKRPQIKLVWTLSITNLISGLHILWLTFLVPEVGQEFQLTNVQQSAIQGGAFIGSILGAPFFGRFADSHGRRLASIISLVLISCAGALSVISTGPFMLGLCQAAIGFGTGGTVPSFVFLSESSTAALRGKTCTVHQIHWGLGSMLAVLYCWLFLKAPGSWRLVSSLCTLTTVLELIALVFLPESPRWLLSKGHSAEAIRALERLAAKQGFHLEPFTLIENNEYKMMSKNTDDAAKSQKPHQKNTGGSDCSIFSKKMRCRTLVIILCWFGSSVGYFGCVNIVPKLFKSDDSVNYFAIMLSAASESTFSFATSVFIEKGRKRCAVFSGAGAAFCILTIGFLAASAQLQALPALAFIGRGLMCSLGGILWVITPENYPTQLRGAAGSCMFSVGRTSAVAAAFLVYSSLSVLQICSVVGLCTASSTFVLAFFLRETAGQVLTDSVDCKEAVNGLGRQGDIIDDEKEAGRQRLWFCSKNKKKLVVPAENIAVCKFDNLGMAPSADIEAPAGQTLEFFGSERIAPQ